MVKRAKRRIVFPVPFTQNKVVNTRSLLMTAFAALCAASAAFGQATPPTDARAPLGEIRGRLTDSVAGRAIASGSIAVRRVGDTAFAGSASRPSSETTSRSRPTIPSSTSARSH
jgi:hypothetical protein